MKDRFDKVLEDTKASVLLIEERTNSKIVITAPHHAFQGQKELPCPEHRVSDENTGFIVRQVAKKLNLTSIVACNYKIDVNKTLTTDYSVQLLRWNPKYLIEIHGHGGIKVDKKKIEISSGPINIEYAKTFTQSLTKHFKKVAVLQDYEIDSNYPKIRFQAKNTATIVSTPWISFHIELPPDIRLNTKERNSFVKVLIKVIKTLD